MTMLIADANFPTASITVLDGHYGIAARGVGRLELDLHPGLYCVQFKAGRAYLEKYVALSDSGPQELSVNLTQAVLPASGPEPQVQLVEHRERFGAGAELAALVEIGADDTATIALIDAAGNTVLQFDRPAADASKSKFFSELDPGAYILQLRFADTTVERAIFLPTSWQTQIFLRTPKRLTKSAWAEAFLTAPLLLAGIGQDISETSVDLAYVRVALQNLAAGRPSAPVAQLRMSVQQAKELTVGLPPGNIDQMLALKFTDPILGILGAHLMLLDSSYDNELLADVTANLERLVPQHPDVLSLRLRLDQSAAFQISDPPMLRSSWRIFVDATASLPNLLRPQSVAARVSANVLASGAWLGWAGVTTGESEDVSDANIDLSSLIANAWNLVRERPRAEISKRVSSSKFSRAESVLLSYLENVGDSQKSVDVLVKDLYPNGILGGLQALSYKFRPGIKPVPKEQIVSSSQSATTEKLNADQVIRNVGLPESAVRSGLEGLIVKLKS
jgi:hypothetical protein